jgi:hypothetical protein
MRARRRDGLNDMNDKNDMNDMVLPMAALI